MSIFVNRMQGLPKGWKREEVLVVGLAKNKLTETIYISPEGTRIKTKKELMEALGPTWNAPECFDFKTYDPSAVGDISHSVAIFFIFIDFLKSKTIYRGKPQKDEAVK